MTALRLGTLLGLLVLALAPMVGAIPLGAEVDIRVDASAEAGNEAAGEAEFAPPTPPLSPRSALSTGLSGGAAATDAAVDSAAGIRAELESHSLGDLTAPIQSLGTTVEARARAALPVGGSSAGVQSAIRAGAEGNVGEWVRALPEPVREAAPPALAAAGLLALVQAFGGWRLAGLGGFALYSRLSKTDLLGNEHRDKVYKLVREKPGIGMTEIGEALGLGWGTVVYHLDRLERAGFVATERAGLRRCCFPVGTVPRESRQAIGALQADATRLLATYLAANPGASQTQVCEALGLSASAASKQVSKLETAGLVRREREWKTVHLYPEPTLREMLGGGTPAATLAGAPVVDFAGLQVPA